MKEYDVFIIGGGKSAEFIAAGLAAQGKKVGLSQFKDRSEDILRNQIGVLYRLLEDPRENLPENKTLQREIDRFRGIPRFKNHRTLEVDSETIQAEKFVVASGSATVLPASSELEKISFDTPDDLSNDDEVESAIVWNGGPLGVSTALALAKGGAETQLLTDKSRLLIQEDEDVAAAVERILKAAKVEIYKNVQVRGAKNGRPKKVTLNLTSHGENFSIQAQRFYPTDCGIPRTADLGLENAGVYLDELGRIVTDETMGTSQSNIFAVGPAAGAWDIAQEDLQAEVALHNLTASYFSKRRLEADSAPWSFPFSPSFCRAGIIAAEAQARISDAVVAVASAHSNDFIKVIGRRKSGEILGAQSLGTGSREIVLMFDMARRAGHTMFDLADRQYYTSPGRTALAAEAVQAWVQSSGVSHSL